MKIAMYNLTTTTKLGGIETFNWGIAKSLAERGHIVHIYGGKGDFREDVPKGVSIFTFPFVRQKFIPNLGSRFRKFAERLSFGLTSFAALFKGRYDLIYVHKPYDLLTALLLSKLRGARVVFGSGGTEFFSGYGWLVRRVDHFFACSEFNAKQIEKYCGVKPAILPNGINTELFRPIGPDLHLRKSILQISDEEKVIISACRLVGWKGLDYSIKAISELLKKGTPVRYLIIGDGEDRERLQLLAVELDIADNVTFLGSIKNSGLVVYYSIADVAVFPSIANETFGISIAEAMACGVPVVSTDVGGIPGVVAEDTGLLVTARRVDELTLAIEVLLNDEPKAESFGRAARERIVENFSWDIIAEKFVRYINNA